jgi:hypothetical protein
VNKATDIVPLLQLQADNEGNVAQTAQSVALLKKQVLQASTCIYSGLAIFLVEKSTFFENKSN